MKKIWLVLAILLSTSVIGAADFGCLSGLQTRVDHGKVQCLYMWAVKHGHITPWWVVRVDDNDGFKYYYVCNLRGDGRVVSRFDYDSLNTQWCDCPK